MNNSSFLFLLRVKQGVKPEVLLICIGIINLQRVKKNKTKIKTNTYDTNTTKCIFLASNYFLDNINKWGTGIPNKFLCIPASLHCWLVNMELAYELFADSSDPACLILVSFLNTVCQTILQRSYVCWENIAFCFFFLCQLPFLRCT